MKHEVSETIGLLRNWKKKVRFVDAGIGQQSCILVAGTARSGTTWVGNVVAEATGSRQMFEPFLQKDTFHFVLRTSRHPFTAQYQPYASATALPGEWHAEIERILQGKIRHWWCDRYNSKLISRQRVVKAVRVNLMLDYFARHWPRLKILFLVRNPLSVVNSQIATIKRGWNMDWKPEYVLNQPHLMADWLEPFRELIESSTDIVSRQTMKWCIENYIPLKCLPAHENVMILRYDDLVQQPQHWYAIADFLADRYWKPDRFARVVNQVSDTAERSPEQISSRTEDLPELDTTDQQTVIDIVHRFGLSEFLYGEGVRYHAA